MKQATEIPQVVLVCTFMWYTLRTPPAYWCYNTSMQVLQHVLRLDSGNKIDTTESFLLVSHE